MEPVNMDARTERPNQSEHNLDQYLYLNWDALNQLPVTERFEALGDLAQRAGSWLRDQRGELIDELRGQLQGGDVAVAEALGVSKQAIGEMGDGPMTPFGVKPKLLKRTAEVIMDRMDPGHLNYSKSVTDALRILGKRSPGPNDCWSAATRIVHAARGVTQDAARDMPYAESRTYARGLAHASEVADRRQWQPQNS